LIVHVTPSFKPTEICDKIHTGVTGFSVRILETTTTQRYHWLHKVVTVSQTNITECSQWDGQDSWISLSVLCFWEARPSQWIFYFVACLPHLQN